MDWRRLRAPFLEIIFEQRRGKRGDARSFVPVRAVQDLSMRSGDPPLFHPGALMRDSTLGIQVIAIGNLTLGGTGKTPVVEKFARELQRQGRKVAILTRGYRSRPKP
jgi:tetraacyldisaccharide-1-P 4'-kinase